MRKHRASVLLAAIALAVAGLLAPASPALAATCTGSGCNGRIVSQTDCKFQAYAIAGVSLVNSANQRIGGADLWYSPNCQAMWGEFNSTSDEMYAALSLETSPEYGGLNVNRFGATHFGKGNTTSTMVDWQQSVRFCAANGAPTTPCTAWR